MHFTGHVLCPCCGRPGAFELGDEIRFCPPCEDNYQMSQYVSFLINEYPTEGAFFSAVKGGEYDTDITDYVMKNFNFC